MPRKILIVDDQEDILLILEREFRRASGIAVFSTSKFAEALPLVAQKKVDLVISDVRIGKDSGFDLIREINRSHPGVSSILMTAYRSAANKQQALDLGALQFLEKPFQISALIQFVENYFRMLDNPEPEAPPAPTPQAPPAAAESTGLNHFKLQDLVQLFCLNGRNIVITVEPQNRQVMGEIYIQRGRVIHADFLGMDGNEAFYALMQLPSPLLKVKDWMAPVPVSIETSWEHLLLQAAIHVDTAEDTDLPEEGTRLYRDGGA